MMHIAIITNNLAMLYFDFDHIHIQFVKNNIITITTIIAMVVITVVIKEAENNIKIHKVTEEVIDTLVMNQWQVVKTLLQLEIL